MGNLLSISYRSVACLTDPTSDVLAIVSESQDRNEVFGITGLLFYNGLYFLQTIEGAPDDATNVFIKIATDERHTDMRSFGVASVDRRKFSNWKMKLIGPNATTRIIPDMDRLSFTAERLAEIHSAATEVAKRQLGRERRQN